MKSNKQPKSKGDPSTGFVDCFCERLKLAIGAQSVRSFAAKVGLSPSGIHQYLTGKSEPTRKAIIAIAKGTSTNIEWLTTGEGPMKWEAPGNVFWGVKETGPSTINVQILQNVLTTIEMVLLENRQTTPPQKKAQITASIYEMFQSLPAETPINKAAILRLLDLTK